ncbi:Membrane-anchored glycerophosphoryl diester phosphodiesterase (GDPDase), membrane domain [Bryocella elongata]|uniref:Membrane-anchored glycerophosphoryl diester phosphodiesterase (GDPDase), membrane domain n=1 Tax=Bryocella elongata TaxID=863522 RepID=A0A1H6AH35_9BACT|nr:glycerophosphoryl diester phosphodiesterase membrane domain-containing protein [Bryocella elongata]SEG47377.1 Membrane-anchored glycerophosphoryl diester phosphodiesterase (GDPDase), membrane domain [Bryocella elongata]
MASTPWSPSPAQPTAPPNTSQGAAFELRPLSLGEILDRIFTVYRSRFWLFCGLLATPALIRVLMAGIVVAVAHFMRARATQATISLVSLAISYSASVLGYLIFSVVHAAVVHALYETYQGRDASISESMSAVSSKWLRYLGIGAWQFFVSGGLYFLFVVPGVVLSTRATANNNPTMLIAAGLLIILGAFIAIPVGAFLYLRYALAIPASVLEDLPVRASIRRSKVLSAGTKGRLLVVLLVVVAMYMVVAALEAPLGYVAVRAAMRHQEALWAQAINLVISFLGTCMVGPIGALGIALVYFDQRVRKEAWDLELLLGGSAAAGTPAPVATQNNGSWVQPEQPRFITADAVQPAPDGGIYQALVARPRAPLSTDAPATPPLPEAEAPGSTTTSDIPPGTDGHSEGL